LVGGGCGVGVVVAAAVAENNDGKDVIHSCPYRRVRPRSSCAECHINTACEEQFRAEKNVF
jgi:hypothetical protein